MVVDDAALGMFVGTRDGQRVVGNYFTDDRAVFFGTQFQTGGPFAPVARDYYFRVLDLDGKMMSTSAVECRRVAIDAGGSITTIYGGIVNDVACPHNSGRDGGVRGGVMVGLAPYDQTILHQRTRIYRAELAAVDDGWVRPLFVEFFVGEPLEPGVCGDGVIEAPEQCDDGNTDAHDGCDGYCVLETGPVCGNGVIEDGEQCDDANAVTMDGCDAQCRIEHLCCCGNGVLEPGEHCDDGNADDGDGCSSQCTVE